MGADHELRGHGPAIGTTSRLGDAALQPGQGPGPCSPGHGMSTRVYATFGRSPRPDSHHEVSPHISRVGSPPGSDRSPEVVTFRLNGSATASNSGMAIAALCEVTVSAERAGARDP